MNSAASQRKAPRKLRIGGLVIDSETCAAWGSRIAGEYIDPKDAGIARFVITKKLLKGYRTKLTPIGEYSPATEFMIVTQSARFNGWKDMDPKLIPPFEEGEHERAARVLLEAEGIMKYTFKTTITGTSY